MKLKYNNTNQRTMMKRMMTDRELRNMLATTASAARARTFVLYIRQHAKPMTTFWHNFVAMLFAVS